MCSNMTNPVSGGMQSFSDSQGAIVLDSRKRGWYSPDPKDHLRLSDTEAPCLSEGMRDHPQLMRSVCGFAQVLAISR